MIARSVRTFTTPRGRIVYDVCGSGPVVVLLHPIGMDRSWWGDYVGAWSERRTVVAVDMLGHGGSDALHRPITLREHAQGVVALLDAEGWPSAALVGVSMGGMVAQYAAVQRPESVHGLIVCASAGGFPDEARAAIRSRGDMSRAGDMADVVPDTLKRWFSERAPAALLEACRRRLLADRWFDWSANWDAISGLDVLDELRKVDVPTLAVSAGADASIPRAATERVAQAARGEFVVVPDAAHFGAFEEPGRFLPVFDAFLLSCEARRKGQP